MSFIPWRRVVQTCESFCKLLNRIRSNQGSDNLNLIMDTFEVHFLPVHINCSFSLPLLYDSMGKGKKKT